MNHKNYLVLMNASFFFGRVLSFKLWVKTISSYGRKKSIVIALFTTLLCHLAVLGSKGSFYILCALRLLLGLFFPLDILPRLISLDYNRQRYN